MPCRRSKNKVRFGGYLDRELYRQIVELANCEGMSQDKFGFVQRLMNEALGLRPLSSAPLPAPPKIPLLANNPLLQRAIQMAAIRQRLAGVARCTAPGSDGLQTR